MTTELRTQFLNFMTLQRFSEHTKRNYVRGVKGLAEFYNQSPDTLTNEQIQEYLKSGVVLKADTIEELAPKFGADGKMQKCDLCVHDIDHDREFPPCVETCPTQALKMVKMYSKEKKQNENHIKKIMAM